mmetsp:Transcript_28355/g.50230  ORF Transcript_28355/g.50230 Transcript_28355/m.50230 type:complete len:88 (+) Transcript_28355:419-682(+)
MHHWTRKPLSIMLWQRLMPRHNTFRRRLFDVCCKASVFLLTSSAVEYTRLYFRVMQKYFAPPKIGADAPKVQATLHSFFSGEKAAAK